MSVLPFILIRRIRPVLERILIRKAVMTYRLKIGIKLENQAIPVNPWVAIDEEHGTCTWGSAPDPEVYQGMGGKLRIV